MSFIRIDTQALRDSLKDLKQMNKRMPKAINSALARSGNTIRTAAARKLREIYFVKHGEVLKKIRVKKNSGGRISLTLEAKDRAIRLINFKASPKGVTARKPRALKVGVKRKGGMKRVAGAFVTSVRGGHTGIFIRSVGAKHRKGKDGVWSQGPIEQLRGPAIPVMLSQEGIVSHIQDVAVIEIDKRLNHEIGWRVFGKGVKK